MRAVLLLVAVAAASCAKPRLQQAEGELSVAPSALEVRTYAGFPVERVVAISNRGRAVLDVAVSASAGLILLGPAALEVAAGQTVSLALRVPAAGAGAVREALSISADGAQLELPVTGEILGVPACPTPATCHAVRFDPLTEACVDEPLADGATCAGVCLDDAHCQAGSCVGKPRSCDDGNKCTQDSCGADGACTHLDTSAQCPAPCAKCSPGGWSSVACKVPACDPRLGCIQADVADGTPCGPNDCSTARVCMTGVCQIVTPPEGSICREATPCQSEGKCVGTTCVSAAHRIAPRWELLDTAKVKRSLLGVVSPGGLIFGVERHDVGIFVVAWDTGGYERWRTPLYTEFWNTTALYDVARAQLVVSSRTWVRALDGATGAQKWFVDLGAEIPLGQATPTGAKQVYPVKLALLPAAGRVVASFSEGYDSHSAWIFGLELATGQQAFKVRRDGHLYGLMSTASDELFIGSAACWGPASWNANLDAAGVARWNVFQAGLPSLTSGTQLYFEPYNSATSFVGRIDLATGAMSQEAAANDKAILANGAKLYLTSRTAPSRLTAWDASGHQQRWALSGLPLTQTFLTEGDGVLGLSSTLAAHVSDEGTLAWSCSLGAPLATTWSTSLVNGLLVGQTALGIGAFPLGTLKVAAHGWSVSDRGNPERTSRAR